MLKKNPIRVIKFKSKKKTGKEYEDFIEYYYSELSKISRQEVSIYRNTDMFGKTGEHNVDVVYDFDYLNSRHKVLVECKDYSRDLDYPTLRSFVAATLDIPASAYIIYSPNGFSKNAKDYAERNGVKCLKMGELDGMLELLRERLQQIVIGNDKTIGEPFWGVHSSESGVMQSFMQRNRKIIYLFHRKKDCEYFAENHNKISGTDLRVYGIRQEQLGLLIRFAKARQMAFIFTLDFDAPGQLAGYLLTPEEVEADYLILPHV